MCAYLWERVPAISFCSSSLCIIITTISDAPILHCAYDPYMICNLIIFKQSQNIVSRPEKVVRHHKIIFLSFRLKVIFMQIRYSRQDNSLHSHWNAFNFWLRCSCVIFKPGSDFFFYLCFNIFKIYGVALFFKRLNLFISEFFFRFGIL